MDFTKSLIHFARSLRVGHYSCASRSYSIAMKRTIICPGNLLFCLMIEDLFNFRDRIKKVSGG